MILFLVGLVLSLNAILTQAASPSAIATFNDGLTLRRSAVENSAACTGLCDVGNSIASSMSSATVPQGLFRGQFADSESTTYYQEAMTVPVAIACGFAILNVIIMLIWCFGRCCCNMCGGRIASKRYTSGSIKCVRVAYAIWFIVIAIATAVVILNNHTASAGADTTLENTDTLARHYITAQQKLSAAVPALSLRATTLQELSSSIVSLPAPATAATRHTCLEQALPNAIAQGNLTGRITAVQRDLVLLPQLSSMRDNIQGLSIANSSIPLRANETGSAFNRAYNSLALTDYSTVNSSIANFYSSANALVPTVASASSSLTTINTMNSALLTTISNSLDYVFTQLSPTYDYTRVKSYLSGASSPSPYTCAEAKPALEALQRVLTHSASISLNKVYDDVIKYATETPPVSSQLITALTNTANGIPLLPLTVLQSALTNLLNTYAPASHPVASPDSSMNSTVAFIDFIIPSLITFRNALPPTNDSIRLASASFIPALTILNPSNALSSIATSTAEFVSNASLRNITCLASILPPMVEGNAAVGPAPADVSGLLGMQVAIESQSVNENATIAMFTRVANAANTIATGLNPTTLSLAVSTAEALHNSLVAPFDSDSLLHLQANVTHLIQSLADVSTEGILANASSIRATLTAANSLTSAIAAAENLNSTLWGMGGLSSSTFSLLGSVGSLIGSLTTLIHTPLTNIIARAQPVCTPSGYGNDADVTAVVNSLDFAHALQLSRPTQPQINGFKSYFTDLNTTLLALTATNVATHISNIHTALSHHTPNVAGPNGQYIQDKYEVVRMSAHNVLSSFSAMATQTTAAFNKMKEFPALAPLAAALQAITASDMFPLTPPLLLPSPSTPISITASVNYDQALATVRNVAPLMLIGSSAYVANASIELRATLEQLESWVSSYQDAREAVVYKGFTMDEQRLVTIDVAVILVLIFATIGLFSCICRKHKPMMVVVMLLFPFVTLLFLLSAVHFGLAVMMRDVCDNKAHSISGVAGNSSISTSVLNGFVSFLGFTATEPLTFSEFAKYETTCATPVPQIITQLKSLSPVPPPAVTDWNFDPFEAQVSATLSGGAATLFITRMNTLEQATNQLVAAGTQFGEALDCLTPSQLFTSAFDEGLCYEVAGAVAMVASLLFLMAICMWPGIIFSALLFKRLNKFNKEGVSAKVDDKDDLPVDVGLARGYENAKLKGFDKAGANIRHSIMGTSMRNLHAPGGPDFGSGVPTLILPSPATRRNSLTALFTAPATPMFTASRPQEPLMVPPPIPTNPAPYSNVYSTPPPPPPSTSSPPAHSSYSAYPPPPMGLPPPPPPAPLPTSGSSPSPPPPPATIRRQPPSLNVNTGSNAPSTSATPSSSKNPPSTKGTKTVSVRITTAPRVTPPADFGKAQYDGPSNPSAAGAGAAVTSSPPPPGRSTNVRVVRGGNNGDVEMQNVR